MPRIPRRRLGTGVFHVWNRAHDRRYVFDTEEDKQVFLSLLAERKRGLKLNIYHWALLSNHFHIAIEALSVADLSRYIGKSCELYSRYWRKKHGGSGTLWQGRFKSCLVQKEGYLTRLGRYIERNPVRAGLCERPWDTPWCSARCYVDAHDDDLVRVHDHSMYMEMGRDDQERSIRYRDYLLTDRERADDEELFRAHRPVIGDENFLAQAVYTIGRFISRRVGRPRKS